MWNLFKKAPLLSEQDEQFQIECYRWLLQHFGGKHFYDEAVLVLPTPTYFPSQVSSPEAAAEQTFARVKEYAGLPHWPCRLEAQEQDPDLEVGEALLIQGVEHSPHGTFSVNEQDEAVISYNPALVQNPIQMVSTFAHELAHYLTCTAPESPPGGWDNWEFATDIAATFLGFGIFQANSAFRFQQFSNAGTHGWKASGGGYLSQAEHSYALAIFLLLKGISPEEAYPYCDSAIKRLLKRALAELEGSAYIDELRQVEYQVPPA